MEQHLKKFRFILNKPSLKFHLGFVVLLLAVSYCDQVKNNTSFWSSYIGFNAFLFVFYLISFQLSNKKNKNLYLFYFSLLVLLSVNTFLLYILIANNYLAFPVIYFLPISKVLKIGFLFFISSGTFFYASSANTFNTNLELEDQNKKIQSENEILRMNFLKVQMNPHFVFNCLVNLNDTLRQGHIAKAIEYNNSVSKLLRHQLQNADKKIIPLALELDWLKQYIEVEMHRNPGLFEYTIECKDIDTHELFIPPMMLQPFVENSIQHAFIPHRNTIRGKLIIRILQTTNEMYFIEIEDNGKNYKLNLEKKLKPNNKSIAIKNINERIQLLKFTSSFSITLNNKFNTTGYCVRLGVCMQQ